MFWFECFWLVFLVWLVVIASLVAAWLGLLCWVLYLVLRWTFRLLCSFVRWRWDSVVVGVVAVLVAYIV